MRIDWGGAEKGWRVWPGGFDEPQNYAFQLDIPAQRVTFHRDETRGWLEVDMAEMTEIDALKVRLADKQTALEDALGVQNQAFALIRGLVEGSIDRSRVTLHENGWTVQPAVEAQAEQIAQEADRA